MFHLYLFGQPRFCIDGQPYRLAAPPKALPLLAYVLLHRQQAVERQQAAFILWPDEPESQGRANLRRHLHHLNKALPPCPAERPWLLLEASSVRWNPDCEYWLDVAEFERLAAAPESLAEAAALYTGDLLETVYDDWLFFERERLQQRYFTVLEQLIQQRRGQCRYAEAIQYGQLILGRDPMREDALRRLVALRYESGDRAGALAEYERFAALLQAEMGVEPMPETRAVYEIVLREKSLPLDGAADASTEPRQGPRLPTARLPFVGRQAEMERLKQLWSQAAHARGGLVLVGGEAGVGKTRLAGELAALIESQGGRVLRGGMSPEDSSPYQAISQAFRGALPLLAGLEGETVRLAALAALLPELRQRCRLPVLAGLAPERERVRLFDAAAGCLERLAEPRPVLLILEDLHWAGESSLALVEFLARRLSAQRVLLLGTYREEQVGRQHPLRLLWRRLQADRLVERLPLRRLEAAAVADLLGQAALPGLAGEAASVAGRLHTASEGNPLFISLFLQHWLEAQGLSEIQLLDLPRGVHAAVQQRLEKLSPLAYTYAEAAAVVGTSFDAEVVREIGGWSESQGLSALDELLDRQLAREGSPGCDYVFAHHLVQSGLYAAIPAERLRRRHRRAAGVLEDVYPERRDELAGALAAHYDRGGEPGRAIPYYRRAAQGYLAVYADSEALQALSRAIQLAGESAAPEITPQEHFDLLEMREAIYNRLGQRQQQQADQEAMEAIARCLADRRRLCIVLRARVRRQRALGEREAERAAIEALKTEAQALGDPFWQAAGLHMDGMLRYLLGDLSTAAALLQQALPLYQAAQDVAGELECTIKLAEFDIHHREVAGAEAWIQKALALSQGQEQAYLAMNVLWLMSANGLASLDLGRCLSYGEQLLAYAQRANDLNWRAAAHRLLAQAHCRLFHIAESRRHLSQAEALYQAIQRPSGLAMVYQTSASLELDLGNYAAARRLYQQALEIDERLGNLDGQAANSINMADVAALLRDYAGQKAYASRALRLARQLENHFLEAFALDDLGEAEREAGNIPSALGYLCAAREICLAQDTLAQTFSVLNDLALCYLAAGDLPAASQTVDEIEAIYPRVEAGAQDSQSLLWVAARVRRATGQLEAAGELLKRAYRLVEERSAAIPEAESRRTFRELIFNRQIIAAYEQEEWPGT